MSIKSNYADAILDRSKEIEFRKRKLAPDISTVVVYSTLPVGRVVGLFGVRSFDIDSPTPLRDRHRHHAGIARAAYRDYYRGNKTAVGILISGVFALATPVDLPPDLWPSVRPPQSFTYLDPGPSLLTSITALWDICRPAPTMTAPAEVGYAY
jgi:predicted transcriptional regulator